MGNEHSKNKEPTKNGKIPEKHENGSANGLSASTTFNGLEIKLNGEATVHQNGEPLSLDLAAESTEPDFVIIESNCQPAEAQVISEIPEPTVQEEKVEKNKEEKGRGFGKMFKKKEEAPAEVKSVEEKETSNEDQTDVSPAIDPQPDLNSSGEEAATTIITEHQETSERLLQKAETSTQTDTKSEANISTQTGEDDDTAAATVSATTEEDSLNESAVVIAEEAIEEAAYEEPFITEEVVVTENNVYENILFRAERVEVTDNFEISHCNSEETELELTTEPESNPSKSITEGEMVAEENKSEDTVLLEASSLPKVVADCVEAVFAAVSESTDYAAVNTPEPRADEVITEDNGEGAGDMSADGALIETTEPEPNVFTPEAGEENGVPSLNEESVTTVMETISEVAHEEPNPTPAIQDTSAEELAALHATEILIKEEAGQEEGSCDDAVAVGDVPEIIEQEMSSNEIITTEELPEDSPIDEVKPESIPEVTADENAEIGVDVISDGGPETVEESEPNPAVVSEGDEVIPEAAIVALSQEFEPNAITPQEPAADNGSPLEEEVIIATVFVPLSGEKEVCLAVPEDETVAEKMTEEAIAALSSEFDAVPESLQKGDVVQESSTEGEFTEAAISEEPVEESDTTEDKTEVPEDVLAQTESTETPEQILLISEEPSEENLSPCEGDAATEVLDNTPESVTEAISEKLEIIENTVEEPEDVQVDVPPRETTEEPEPCVSVREEVLEENVAPAEALVEDPDEDAPPVVDVETLESVEPTDNNPVDPEESVEESEPQPETEVLVVVLKTTEDEVSEEKTPETDSSGDVSALVEENYETETLEELVAECVEAVLETIVEDVQGDVPPMETTEESEPCVSVREELLEENVAPAEALVEDPDKDAPPAVDAEALESIEPTDNNPVHPEEPVEENEPQPETEVVVVVLETTEDEVTEEKTPETDNSGDVSAVVEENYETETLEELVAECVEAVLETIVEDVQVDVPPMETTEESEPCVSVQEEVLEENVAPAEVLVEDPDKDAPPVVDAEEPVEESEPQPETEVVVVVLKTTEVSEEITPETDNSGDVSVSVLENSETETLDGPVAECVEAVLETILEEIITEETECNPVTSDEAGPEITAEEETKEKAESESSMNTTDTTLNSQSEGTSVTSTDMETLVSRLQSACTSVVEESTYRLGCLEISSLGYTITVIIHVDPKTEEQ